jgi:hypothetical protein
MSAQAQKVRLRRLLVVCALTVTATIVYTWNGRQAGPPPRPQLQAVTKSPLADLSPPPLHLFSDGATAVTQQQSSDARDASASSSAVGGTAAARSRNHPSVAAAGSTPVNGSAHKSLTTAGTAPMFLFLHTGRDLSYHKLAVEYVADGVTRREATPLSCRTAHFAAGRGVCLSMPNAGVMAFTAELFDSNFRVTRTLPLTGFPSRTRVSPDGRLAAITVFVTGHSYGTAGFSTATQIIDAVTGDPVVANLEQMEVRFNGARFQSPDANFWGVTFTKDPNRFYATLSARGTVYLVEGKLRENRVTVIREAVECPSLSPDNTRVAFKSRVAGEGLARWRVHVLDLESLTDIPLAETENVDEQVGWLDDAHVTYSKSDPERSTSMNVWAVPADGSGAPVLVLREAGYATTLRP